MCRGKSFSGSLTPSDWKDNHQITVPAHSTAELTIVALGASGLTNYNLHTTYGGFPVLPGNQTVTLTASSPANNTDADRIDNFSISVDDDYGEHADYTITITYTFASGYSCTMGMSSASIGGGGPATPYHALSGLMSRANAFLHGLADFAAEPVDVARGALVEKVKDISLPVRGPALDDTRTYDSDNPAMGIFGIGWSSLWDSELILSSDWHTFTWREASGASVWFTLVDGSWEPESSSVTATLTSTSNGWTVRTSNGTRYVFGNNPGTGSLRLTRVIDRNGYEQDIYWPSSLPGSILVVGRVAPGNVPAVSAYLVPQLNGAGLVTSISDSSGRSLSFGYSANRLISVSSTMGDQWSYGYDPGGRLSSMTDPSGATTVTKYWDSSGREGAVKAQWSPDAVAQTNPPTDISKATSFDYDGLTSDNDLSGTTTITYPDGSEATALYSHGLLIEYRQMDGAAEVASWAFEHDPVTKMISMVTKSEDNYTQSPLIAMNYTANGWLTDYYSPLGHVIYSGYNAFGEPSSVTRGAGTAHPVVTTYWHDGSGNLTGISRPWTNETGGTLGINAVIALHHGDSDHPEDVTSVGSADGTVTHYAYVASNGLLASTTNPWGEETTYWYDSIGDRVATVSPSGNVPGADVTAHRSVSVNNAAGESLISMDAVSAGVGDGFVRASNSSSLGASPTGETWSTLSGTWSVSNDTAYGANGVAVLPDADLSGSVGYEVTYAVADASQNLVGLGFRVQDGQNYWGVEQVPGFHLWALVKVTAGQKQYVATAANPAGPISEGDEVTVRSVGPAVTVMVNGKEVMNASDTALDGATGVGLVSEASTSEPIAEGFAAGKASGSTRLSGYDALGRVTWTAGPGLASDGLVVTSTDYDANGNEVSYVDGNGNSTSTGWDALGRMSWQSAGAPAGQVGPKTEYSYDSLGRLTRVQSPGRNAETISYAVHPTTLPDAVSAWSKQVATRPDGVTVTTWKDSAGRPVEVDASNTPENPDATYTWDSLNRLVGSTSDSVVMSRSLDSLGDLLSESRDGRKVSYAYAATNPGRLSSITYPGSGHTVTEGYDSSGRWSSVTDWAGNQTTFDWGSASDAVTHPNVVGMLKQVTFPGGSGEGREFDADGAVSKVTYEWPAGAWPISYSRGKGEVLSSRMQLGGTSSWNYDASGELLSETNPSGSYDYDTAGNPTKVKSTFQTFDESGALCWSAPTSGTCGAPPSGATVYHFDQDGERVAAGSNTYSYDAFGQMTASTTSAGTTSYRYAGDGLRVSKSTGSGTTEFAWDTRSGTSQLIQDGGNFYIYGPGGLPIERIGSDPIRFLSVDGTGSVTVADDDNGGLASTRAYDAWGNVTASTGVPVSLGWQGQYQDSETGFYYLRHRYYDPATTQFTTADPLEALTGDRYGYAGNDPVNSADPNGLIGYGPIAAAFDGIVGGLGPVLESIGDTIVDYVDDHPAEVAIALGVVSVATGFVPIALGASGISTGLTVASVVAGGGAAGLDQNECSNGSDTACIVRNVGIAGAVLGFAPVPVVAGFVTESSGLGVGLTATGAFGLGLGQAALFTDVASAIQEQFGE